MDPAPELPSLPDVPLRTIVSLIPLQQLISTFPRVHPRFSPIRASVLRSNQRLLLHIGDAKEIKKQKYFWPERLPLAGHLLDSTGALLYPNTYPSDFYRLSLSTLDSHNVERLSTHMPAIAHLEVILGDVDLSVLSHLTILLTLWAPTLRTLKLLLGRSFHRKGQAILEIPCQLPAFRLLLRVLNQTLTGLEHLSLGIHKNTFPHPNEGDTSLSLPVIGRLREFNFSYAYSGNTEAFILDALDRFATEKLTHIGLPGCYVYGNEPPALTRHRLASRFTQIPFVNYFSSDAPSLPPVVIGRAFPNLTVSNWIFAQCEPQCKVTSDRLIASFRAYSRLAHLRFLTLSSFNLALPHLTGNFTQLPPLRLLKVLTIDFWTRDCDSKQGHDRLEAPFWATLFPGVQIVKVAHQGRFCGSCHPGEGEKTMVDYAQVTPCLTQLLAPLKVLPSLRKIFYQHARQSDAIAEFTPEGTFVRTHEYVG